MNKSNDAENQIIVNSNQNANKIFFYKILLFMLAMVLFVLASTWILQVVSNFI